MTQQTLIYLMISIPSRFSDAFSSNDLLVQLGLPVRSHSAVECSGFGRLTLSEACGDT